MKLLKMMTVIYLGRRIKNDQCCVAKGYVLLCLGSRGQS